MAIIITAALTILLAIGARVVNLAMDSPDLIAEEIMNAGFGLISLILLTLLFAVILISIISAGAVAAVVNMAKRGFEGNSTGFSDAIEGARKHSLSVLFYWILLTLGFLSLFLVSLLPAGIMSLAFGGPGMGAVAAAILFMVFASIMVVVLYIGFMFAPQFIVVAETGAIGSMKKSFEYVKMNLGAVIIYLAVVIVFSFFMFAFFGILAFVPELLKESNRFLGTSVEIFSYFLRLIMGLLIAPYFEMVKTRMILNTI